MVESQSGDGVVESGPFYEVIRVSLASAFTNTPRNISGSYLGFFTTGSLDQINVRLDKEGAPVMWLDQWNPIYTDERQLFSRFFLTNAVAQSGKNLYIFIGKEGKIKAGPQFFSPQVVITIKTDKDTHFTGAIAQNAVEAEDIISGLNKCIIERITIQSDENLDYRLYLWRTDAKDDTNLDTDSFTAEQRFNLPTYGHRIAGAGQYYMSVGGLGIHYEDTDETGEIHCSLQCLSAAGKTAGANGEVVVEFTLRRI